MDHVNGLHADHADAIDTAEQKLKEIMEGPDWRGDYTVWLSPQRGPNKQQRVRFAHGQSKDRDSALSELQKLPLWQEGQEPTEADIVFRQILRKRCMAPK